jgi:uncharacterized protein involved in oxidation of intracellular sulfur
LKYLVILDDPPYGTERFWNGLRLASGLTKRPDTEVRVYLTADAVSGARTGQRTPNGFYNLERMLKELSGKGINISTCSTCLEARGIMESDMIPGIERGSIDVLTDWTIWADKAIVF